MMFRVFIFSRSAAREQTGDKREINNFFYFHIFEFVV